MISTRRSARRHPVLTFALLLVLGPYLIAAGLAFVGFYVLGAVIVNLLTMGRRT